MNHPTGLLSLNDDVLLATFSFLDSRAALATASTSKSAYRLAISFVFVDLSWGGAFNVDKGDGSESLALSRYMCAPEPLTQVVPRVQHLRHFTLGFDTRKVDLPPLRIILSQAFNLRTIRIRHFESFIEDCDGLVIKAIGAMHHLEQAEFQQSGPETVSALPNLLSSQKLTCLTLVFDQDYYEDDFVGLPALLSGLSSAPSIRTLIISFNHIANVPLMRTSYDFALASIRDLTVASYPGPVSAHIITLCPNIDTLSLMLYAGNNPPATLSMSAEDRWPARLKKLDLPYRITIAEDTVQRIKPVHCLSFGEEKPIRRGETFLPLLKTFRPTALELHTKSDLAEPGQMWDDLRGAAPQLRSLSIVVKAQCGEYNARGYVDPLIAALRSTSLVHLSLRFPPTGRYSEFPSMAEVGSLCAAEIRRVETLRQLPVRLSEDVPSLRLFALSWCKPGTMLLRGPGRPELTAEIGREEEIRRRGGPDSEFLNAPMRKIRELRAEIARDKRWWWIEGEGAARTPVEIWREDGERALDLIKRADFDPKKGLDGFYSDKCRYER